MDPINENAVGYARRLYDSTRDWYASADSKAQVVLAIDGTFLTFLTTAIFAKRPDLNALIDVFSIWTWCLLSLMVLSVVTSVVSAIYCLWSRTYSQAELRKIVDLAQHDEGNSGYAPRLMWFFQFVAELESKRFCEALTKVNDIYEIEVMAYQIQTLAGNVRKKHRAVNLGFVSAAGTLILFLASGLSYLAGSL